MVSIVEVEQFGSLPFSNWPDFDQKLSKYVVFFWSFDEVIGDLRNHVCSFVHPLVTQFLENRSLLFSETAVR